MGAPNGPRITVSSLDSEGVRLLSVGAPEFHSAFHPARPKESDALLPYTVVIQNGAEQEIIAFSVLWRLEGSEEMVETQLPTLDNLSEILRAKRYPDVHRRPATAPP